MTTRLTLAIQEHFEQLSPSERKLAKLLLDSNPTEPYWEDSFMTVVFRYLYHDRISN
jgi:hypothetical protein